MSSKPDPKLIGAFVSGALIFLLGMLIFFGSSRIFSKESRYILFFDQSVNGLSVGSSVKFRGVPVGVVEQVLIRIEGQAGDSNAIPVVISINQSMIENNLGVTGEAFDSVEINEYLNRGLVGQLSVESYITGQIFVELSFHSKGKKSKVKHMQSIDGLVEIPTVGTSFDQITSDVSSLIANFSSVDLQELGDNLNQVLSNIAVVLDGVDGEGLSKSLSVAINELTLLLKSEELKSTIVAARSSLREIENTAKVVGVTAESYNLEEGPLVARLDSLSGELSQSFSNVDVFFQEASTLLEPSSTFRYEIESTMRELALTAKAIRVLVDYLEGNPNALITGRSDSSSKEK